jgi:hypothetical protein
VAAVERDEAMTALSADGLDAHNAPSGPITGESPARLDIEPSLVTRLSNHGNNE